MPDEPCDARARGGRMLRDAGYKAKRKRGGKIDGKHAKDRPDRHSRSAVEKRDAGGALPSMGMPTPLAQPTPAAPPQQQQGWGGQGRWGQDQGQWQRPMGGGMGQGMPPGGMGQMGQRPWPQPGQQQAAARGGKIEKRAGGGKIGKGKVIININAGGDKPAGGMPMPPRPMAPPIAPPVRPPMAPPGAGMNGPAPAGMAPRPPMAGPPGAMPPRPGMPPGMMPHAHGGMVRRDSRGRFTGGAV